MLYPQQNQYRDLSILDGVWQFRLDPDDVGLNSKWHDGFTDMTTLVSGGIRPRFQYLAPGARMTSG